MDFKDVEVMISLRLLPRATFLKGCCRCTVVELPPEGS